MGTSQESVTVIRNVHFPFAHDFPVVALGRSIEDKDLIEIRYAGCLLIGRVETNGSRPTHASLSGKILPGLGLTARVVRRVTIHDHFSRLERGRGRDVAD